MEIKFWKKNDLVVSGLTIWLILNVAVSHLYYFQSSTEMINENLHRLYLGAEHKNRKLTWFKDDIDVSFIGFPGSNGLNFPWFDGLPIWHLIPQLRDHNSWHHSGKVIRINILSHRQPSIFQLAMSQTVIMTNFWFQWRKMLAFLAGRLTSN